MEKLTTRVFSTGANRNSDTNKLDYEGFLSPLVLQRYAEYMHKNRFLEDGTMREGDNWQKGIPQESLMKSGWRHHIDWWQNHRGLKAREDVEEACCGLLFNCMGYLHNYLKEKK